MRTRGKVTNIAKARRARLRFLTSIDEFSSINEWIEERRHTVTEEDLAYVRELRSVLRYQQKALICEATTLACDETGTLRNLFPDDIEQHINNREIFVPLLDTIRSRSINLFVMYAVAFYFKLFEEDQVGFCFAELIQWLDRNDLKDLQDLFLKHNHNLLSLEFSVQSDECEEMVAPEADILPMHHIHPKNLKS